jgi:hypothetical protein
MTAYGFRGIPLIGVTGPAPRWPMIVYDAAQRRWWLAYLSSAVTNMMRRGKRLPKQTEAQLALRRYLAQRGI